MFPHPWHIPAQHPSLSPPADRPIPARPAPDPAPRYRGVLQPPRRLLRRRWVSPGEAGAAGRRGPEAQLLLVCPQQRPGAESHAAAGAGESPRTQHGAPWKHSGVGVTWGCHPAREEGSIYRGWHPGGEPGAMDRPARRRWWLWCLKPPLLRWDGRGRAAAPLTLAIPTVYHRHWREKCRLAT